MYAQLVICPACEHEVHPMQELTENGGIAQKCPRATCNAILPTETAEKPPAEKADMMRHTNVIPLQGVTTITRTPDDDEPFLEVDANTILEMARTRLEWVDARMGELEQLKGERDVLQRMIDAAKPARRRRAKR